MSRRQWTLLIVALWVVTRAVIFVSSAGHGILVGDVVQYGARVARMFQGEIPYRDIGIEYPPGSLVFTIVPGLLVGVGRGYSEAFALEMLAVDAVGLWLALRLAKVADRGRPRIPLAYVLAVAAVGPLLVLRFDLVPAVAVLAAALLAAERRPGWAALVLGFATAVKLYPAVVAPALVLGLVPLVGWRAALKQTVPPFVLGLAVPFVPALLASVRGVGESLAFQAARGIQLESLWASIIEIAHDVGLTPAVSAYGSGAYNVVSPLSTSLGVVSSVLDVAAVVAAWIVVARRARSLGGLRGTDWAAAFALCVFAFLLPAHVLSPQYLIWLTTIVAATADRRPGRVAVGALIVAALISLAIFPLLYFELRQLDWPEVALLAVRNALLVAVAVLVLRAFLAPRPEPDGVTATGPPTTLLAAP